MFRESKELVDLVCLYFISCVFNGLNFNFMVMGGLVLVGLGCWFVDFVVYLVMYFWLFCLGNVFMWFVGYFYGLGFLFLY